MLCKHLCIGRCRRPRLQASLHWRMPHAPATSDTCMAVLQSSQHMSNHPCVAVLYLQVVVAEAAPRCDGQVMARRLAELGLQTTLIADCAIFAMMARVNKVCLAADLESWSGSSGSQAMPSCLTTVVGACGGACGPGQRWRLGACWHALGCIGSQAACCAICRPGRAAQAVAPLPAPT